jgi:site-specific DNA-methyltransferase (adenine-specific)
MIYEKNSASFPATRESKRYSQIFEYMFVFVKGEIRSDIQLLADKPNKWAGVSSWGNLTHYEKDGSIKHKGEQLKSIPAYSMRNNIWRYNTGLEHDNKEIKHPAIFPEKLAEDHIKSWSVKGDVVLDPFAGSCTTGKMAILNGRDFIGIELNPEFYKKGLERVRLAELEYNSFLFK